MKSLKITALSLVLVLLLAACGAKNDTPDEPVSYTHLRVHET